MSCLLSSVCPTSFALTLRTLSYYSSDESTALGYNFEICFTKFYQVLGMGIFRESVQSKVGASFIELYLGVQKMLRKMEN